MPRTTTSAVSVVQPGMEAECNVPTVAREPRGLPRRDLYLGTLLVAGVTLVAYWKAIGYPFAQDDWFMLESLMFQHTDGLSYAGGLFLPNEGSLFYRPLGLMFLLALQRTFGLNELGFHSIHVLLHVAAALAVAGIAYRLTRDRFVAWTVGALAAGAVVVRLFPSLWMVGSYDLAGALFFLLALLLFIDGRILWAAAAFLVALLFKEASVTLLAVVAAYHLLYRFPAGPLRARAGAFARELWPFALVVGLWVIPKLQNLSPFSVPPGDPYRAELEGSVLWDNLRHYLGWSGRSVIPSKDFGGDVAGFRTFTGVELALAAAVVVGLLAAAVLLDRRRASGEARPRPPVGLREVAFCAVWWLAALAPVLPLANHRYSYYLVYSLPAFLILAVGGLATVAGALVHDRRLVVGVVAGCAAAGLVANVVQTYRLERTLRRVPVHGFIHAGVLPFALGQTVKRVERALQRDLPSVPRGAVFVLQNLDGAALQGVSALRVWYRDPGLEVVGADSIGEGDRAKVVLLREDPERPLEVQVVRSPSLETLRESG